MGEGWVEISCQFSCTSFVLWGVVPLCVYAYRPRSLPPPAGFREACDEVERGAGFAGMEGYFA